MARLTKASLKTSLTRLAEADAALADAIDRFGLPALRRRDPGFTTLLRAIVGQQVSVAAASAIWGRLEGSVTAVTPEAIAHRSHDELRAVGLSRQKIAYAHGLANDVLEGRVALDRRPASVSLNVAAENEPAIALYRSLGFVVAKRPPDEPEASSTYMERALVAPRSSGPG